MINQRLIHRRCNDGVPCAEVVDRLHAVDIARRAGVDDPAAVARLLWWARRHAEAHGYGMEREGV
jgi:hypothetical protein